MSMYGKTYDRFAPVDYTLADYEVPGYPGLFIQQAELGIDIDYLNDDEPFIDTITIMNPDNGKYTKVTKDHPLGFLFTVMSNDNHLMCCVCEASEANA